MTCCVTSDGVGSCDTIVVVVECRLTVIVAVAAALRPAPRASNAAATWKLPGTAMPAGGVNLSPVRAFGEGDEVAVVDFASYRWT